MPKIGEGRHLVWSSAADLFTEKPTAREGTRATVRDASDVGLEHYPAGSEFVFLPPIWQLQTATGVTQRTDVASESAAGVVEIPTALETQNGTPGAFAVPPDKLQAELTRQGFPAIRPDLASTSDAVKGSALVGHRGRTLRAKLDEGLSVMDFGAVGDGTTDDTTAIQAAIDAVHAAGGGTVLCRGRFRTTAPINVKSKVELVGDFHAPPDMQNSNQTDPIPITQVRTGVFLVDHNQGSTNPDHAAFRLSGNSAGLVGITAYYPNQTMPKLVWQPDWPMPLEREVMPTSAANTGLYRVVATDGTSGTTEPVWPSTTGQQVTLDGVTYERIGTYSRNALVYPPTIALDDSAGNVKTPHIRDCFFPNSYDCIDFSRRNNLALVERVWIGAFKKGITLDRATGIPRVKTVHFLGWYDVAFGEADKYTQLDPWVQANLVAVSLGECDQIRMDDVFVHRCFHGAFLKVGEEPRVGIDPAKTAAQRVAWGTITNFGCELVANTGVRVESTDSSKGITLLAPSINATSGQMGLHLSGSAVSGASAPVVHVSEGKFGGTGALYHVNHQSGTLTLNGGRVHAAPDAAGFSVRLSSGFSYFVMSGVTFSSTGAGLQIPTAIGGRAILVGNDLGAMTYNNPPAKPSGGYRAVANLGITDA